MNKHEATIRMTTDPEALKTIVDHAMGLCPALCRVFLLCEVRGLTIDRAAAILGISPAAVRTRLHRARREMNLRLRAFLERNPAGELALSHGPFSPSLS